MNDINTEVIDLPLSIRGVTALKGNTYYIFINGNYNAEERNEILKEELAEIKKASFGKFKFKEGDKKK